MSDLAAASRPKPRYPLPSPPLTLSNGPEPSRRVSFRTWMPAIIVLIGMPVLALTTAKYVLLPPMQQTYAQINDWKDAAANTGAPSIAIKQILNNPSDRTGAHPIVSSLTLVGNNSAFPLRVNQNKPKLLDLTIRILGGKTVSDLEKPEVRKALRAQLLANFNRALGGPVLKDVCITEWRAE